MEGTREDGDASVAGQKRKEQEKEQEPATLAALPDESKKRRIDEAQPGSDEPQEADKKDKEDAAGGADKFGGQDSSGQVYDNEDALWQSLKRDSTDMSAADRSEGWYKGSGDYWAKVEPTLDGVLGGFGFLSAIDIKTSRSFLSAFMPSIPSASSASTSSTALTPIGNTRALDCGAGIGRITRDLLLDLFERVDLVEPDARFLNKAKQQLSPLQPLSGHRVDGFFCEGLQTFSPTAVHYDLIWIQWVIGYLTDVDFVAFLKRCKEALREHGLVVVKDNINSKEEFFVDMEDNSITRSDAHLRRLFNEAGLLVVKEALQEDFPPGMLPVRLYALRSS